MLDDLHLQRSEKGTPPGQQGEYTGVIIDTPWKVSADSKEGEQTARGNGGSINSDLLFTQNNVEVARQTRQLQFLYPTYQTFCSTLAEIHRRSGQR